MSTRTITRAQHQETGEPLIERGEFVRDRPVPLMETERPSSAPPGIDPAAGAQQQPGIMHHPGQDNQSLGGYGKRARESRLGNLTLQNAPKKHRAQGDETGIDEDSSSEEFTTEYEVSDADTIRTGPTQPRQVYIQPAKLQVGDPMGPPPVPVPAIRVNPGTPNVVITRTTQDAISPRQRDDTIRPVNAIMIERPKQTTATSSYSDYPTVYQRTAALEQWVAQHIAALNNLVPLSLLQPSGHYLLKPCKTLLHMRGTEDNSQVIPATPAEEDLREVMMEMMTMMTR